MPASHESGRSVSSRLLQVLFAFQLGRSALTIAELTRITGMPHATVRRLAMELVEAGALDRGEDGRLTVGIRLWRLGALAPLTLPLRQTALPFMEDLRTALGEHVQLAVRDGSEVVIIERLSTPRAVGVISRVGGRLPLHASAVGRILLAHADAAFVDEFIEGDLPAFTRRTITRPDQLRRQLAEDRSCGVAVVREELSPLADSVATRIINADGRVVAALSVVVRSGTTDLRAATPSLIASGLGISRLLGWEPRVGVR